MTNWHAKCERGEIANHGKKRKGIKKIEMVKFSPGSVAVSISFFSWACTLQIQYTRFNEPKTLFWLGKAILEHIHQHSSKYWVSVPVHVLVVPAYLGVYIGMGAILKQKC